MKTRVAWLASLVLLLSAPALSAQGDITGRWTGVWIRDGSALSVEFSFARKDTGYTGTFATDQLRVTGIPLARITNRAGQVSFSLPGDRTTAVFTGRIRGDSLSGTFVDGPASGTFALVRRARTAFALREENVTFRNGDVALSGTIILPRETGRRPAIVFVHGSGAEGRWANRFLATRLAERGIAALVFDKRGVGQSTGDWRSADFDDLAGDVIAGITLLRARADVDSTKIGIHGHSQGGTIAPLIATRARVAFVIASAGSGVSPADAEIYSLENSMDVSRLDSAEARMARQYAREVVAVAYEGKDRRALDSLVGVVRSRPWAFELPAPTSHYWTFSRRIASYDPLQYWREIRAPVLLLYGARDERVPPKLSASRIASELLVSGNSFVTVRVFPDADHTFRVSHSAAGKFAWPETAEGYLRTLFDWTAMVTR